MTCGGSNNKVKVWNVGSYGSPANQITLSQVNSCAWEPTAETKFGAGASNNKLYYDPISGGGGDNENVDHCVDVSFAGDGSKMVAACKKGVIYTVSSGNDANVLDTGDNFLAAAYAQDSSFYTLGGKGETLYILNTSNQVVSNFHLQEEVTDIDISDDSEYIVASTKAGEIYEYAKVCLLTGCPEGYYMDGSHTCNLCWSDMLGCAVCTSATFCTQCLEDFLINTGTHLC